MEFLWLYSLCQSILSVCVIVVSVRLCMVVSGAGAVKDIRDGAQGARPQPGSVSCCLRLCLGWVGAIGGAVGIPVMVFLNFRIPQCLYTCITLVCCPLLVRQFTMCLFMLLTVDDHLQHHLAERYSMVVTRKRCLCVVLLCWVASVLSSFAQFISSEVLDTWGNSWAGRDPGSAGLGLDGNWTTSAPHLTPSSPPKYHPSRKVIGRFLPYGGFLSKFYVEGLHNFTYAEIHRSHWGICAPDTALSPQFLVYVHGTTVFMLPLLCLLVIYLDLLCKKPRKSPFSHADPAKHGSRRVHSLALSLSLLVLLCLPLHIIHALLLFTPSTNLPAWAHAMAMFLFQLYGLVPQLLFIPSRNKGSEGRASFPLSLCHFPEVAPPRGKSVRKVLREAMQAAPWSAAKHSLKAKVCPEV